MSKSRKRVLSLVVSLCVWLFGDPASSQDLQPPSLSREAHGHPPYPSEADGRPARVLLELTIGEDGAVLGAKPLSVDREGAQAALFTEMAVTYVLGLSFEPATRDGQPVPASVRFEVLFDPPKDEHPPHTHKEEEPHVHDEKPPSRVVAGDENALEEVETSEPTFSATAVVPPSDLSASSIDLSGEELRLRPYLSTGELLNAAPGFYVIQHAGGGKANQYFLRGFDADHGTDIAFFVDGVPINWVSHGHGQGYTDLNFVIPELIKTVEVRKGPYFAEYGDFDTAGAINLVLDSDKPVSSIEVGGGNQSTYRGVAILSPDLDSFQPLIAAEVFGTDGPFEVEEDHLRFNLFARGTFDLRGDAQLALTASAYIADWNASGQIPLREVEAGRLNRFGSIDENEGGNSQRYTLYLNVSAPGKVSGPRSIGGEGLRLVGWVIHSRFALYSNFTFFSRDQVNGDMIRQGDTRTAFGLRTSYGFAHRFGEVTLKSTLGANFRFDAIDNTLDDAPARERSTRRVDASIGEGSIGLFAEEEIVWRWLRLVGGLRVDYFGFNVEDRLEDLDSLGSSTSGELNDAIVSPKGSVIVTPVQPLQLFFNVGRGFHSNDARGVVLDDDPVTPLSAALGWEVGARVLAWDRLQLSTVFFWLRLDNEVVWIGDEGTTEVSDATRRFGIEAQARLQILPWLLADVDATWVQAEFIDAPAGEDAIPLAPRVLVSGGLTVLDERTGLSGRIGVFYLGDRPATEDRFLTARGFTRLDASIAWEQERFRLELQALNLLNTNWEQAQFATVSRLPSDVGPSSCPEGTRPVVENGVFVGCEDLHFTPGWPIQVLGSVTVKF